MSLFEDAFEEVIGLEGGYVNDPNDPGGETKYGITHATLARARKYDLVNHNNIKDLTLDEARNIYWTLWWNPLLLSQLLARIAIEVFEQAVNFGLVPAVNHLQQALVWMGARIDVDGVMGKFTIEAASKLVPSQVNILLKMLNGLQFMRYVEIVKANPSQKKFFVGWMRRVSELT